MMPEVMQIIESLRDVKSPFTLLFVAVLAGGVVRILKTKRMVDILDKMPLVRRFVPEKRMGDVAIVIAGIFTFLDGWLNAKLTIAQALAYAVLGAVIGGGTAIGGHETIAKRIAPKPSSGGDGPVNREGDTEAPPPGVQRVILTAVFGLIMGIGIVLSGCGLLTPKNVTEAVLSASDIACLENGEGSRFTDADEAAIACKLAQDPILRSIVRNLVGQRNAAKRAGFVWSADGGHIETVSKSQSALAPDGGADGGK